MTATTTAAVALDERVSCFWVFRLRPSWRLLDREARRQGIDAMLHLLQPAGAQGVTIRGAYTLAGLNADADLMLWCLSNSAEAISELAIQLRRTGLGQHLESREVFMGLAGPSEYNPDHLPAFLKGDPPRRYVSVYPFVKTPAWYLLPAAERGAMMAEHGRAGREHAVAANTVRSFGLGDSEFIVALEADHLKDLVDCMDALRRLRVREYTLRDSPIYLGRLVSVEAALTQLV